MEAKLIHSKFLWMFCILLGLPLLILIYASFIKTGVDGEVLSMEGFSELTEPVRYIELSTILWRSVIVSSIATALSYLMGYSLKFYCSRLFQSIFLLAITLPFVVNESVRVFSWQFLLSENGVINNLFHYIYPGDYLIVNGSNDFNIYFGMLITSIPFGVFINYATLTLIPRDFKKQANDLKLSAIHQFLKIYLPLSKYGIAVSFFILCFITFALSSEVDFLGGDTKISLRTFISSLQTASKFQSVYALGTILLGLCVIISFSTYFLRIVKSQRR